MKTCTLETHPEHDGCCCQCKYRLRTRSHPHGDQIGWACFALAFMEGENIAYLGEFEHGMCELFTRRVGEAIAELERGKSGNQDQDRMV